MFIHLFRKGTTLLTIKQIQSLLKPAFSEDGSNDRQYEGATYHSFIKYLRQVATAGFQHFLSKLNAEFMVQCLTFMISLKKCTFGLNDQMFELENGMFELTKCILKLNDRPGNTRNACLT